MYLQEKHAEEDEFGGFGGLLSGCTLCTTLSYKRNSSESSIKLYNEQFLTHHGFDTSRLRRLLCKGAVPKS